MATLNRQSMVLEPHILAIVGAITAAAGVGVIIWMASIASSRNSNGTSESLLAPTLAVDTLDPDLRVAYMRTLVLDARLQTRIGPRAPEGRALGREIRRALVGVQAARHAGREVDVSFVEALLDEATASIIAGTSPDQGWATLVAIAREKRAEFIQHDRSQRSFE